MDVIAAQTQKLRFVEKLARQTVVKAGGRIEKDRRGNEVFVIPVKEPAVSKFEDIKSPGPPAGSQYSPQEMTKIVMQDPPPAPKKSK